MIGLSFLVVELFILYLLSRVFIRKLFTILFRMTRSRERASVLLGVVFLPGTFIHEMAHFMMALFTFVPVGRISLMPELQEGGIKLGSVEIAKTDFLRGSLIGLAPLIVGSSLVLGGISFVLSNESYAKWWIVLILVYFIFQITHTMFASKSDLRAVLELVVFLAIITAALLFFKINEPFLFLFEKIQMAGPFLENFSLLLLIPIGIETMFLALFRKVV